MKGTELHLKPLLKKYMNYRVKLHPLSILTGDRHKYLWDCYR